MEVLFGDLAKNYKINRKAIDKAVGRVLNSGWFILGPEVRKFESAFAKYCNVKYTIGVGNGMEALEIALLALGVGRGDQVITTPLSAAATALAIRAVGARPVYADIDEKTFNISAQSVVNLITKKTKAILPVHLYGQMADMKELKLLAKKNKLLLVEDAAQGHGARFNGRSAGSFSHAAAFSFYPSKNLGAYGDGGCVVTNSKAIAFKSKQLRDYGQEDRYNHVTTGLNSRLDELQAAILNTKLRNLDKENKRRKKLAEIYKKLLSDAPVQCPYVDNSAEPVWHLYVIRVSQGLRDQLRDFLKSRGIATQIHYPRVLYKQTALLDSNAQCPVAERVVGQIISLPIYSEMSEKQVTYVARQVKNFFKNI